MPEGAIVMTAANYVLAAILAWPVYWGDRDEPLEAREARAEEVASVIIDVTSNPHERLFLAVQGGFESGYAGYVLEDRCHEGPKGAQCDGGQSSTPWQVKRYCSAAWKGVVNEKPPVFPVDTRRERWLGAAECVLRIARQGRRRCGNWNGAFAGQLSFARTKTAGELWCEQSWTRQRSEKLDQLVQKLLAKGG